MATPEEAKSPDSKSPDDLVQDPLLRAALEATAVRLETGIGLTMIRIEPKPFMMGSPPGESGRRDEETQHQVTISKPYWIGETQVTERQWREAMGDALWQQEVREWGGIFAQSTGDHYPVTTVSWHMAVAFCAELTKRERSAGRLPAGYEYTLPSEAEWEYACRGGSTTAYCYGDDEQRLAEYAVFGKKYEYGISPGPVRQKKANAFGLYDMHGNVGELCADYADHYKDWTVGTDTYGGAVTDPISLRGAYRVVRGGQYSYPAAFCRSAYRSANAPDLRDRSVGFRPALAARPPVK